MPFDEDAVKQMLESDIKEKETMNKRFRLMLITIGLLIAVCVVICGVCIVIIGEIRTNREYTKTNIEVTKKSLYLHRNIDSLFHSKYPHIEQ